jgi:hypothetical protein
MSRGGWERERPGMSGLVACGFFVLATVGGVTPVSAQSVPTMAPPAAPSSPGTSATDDVESLRARVATFWAARVKGDATAQWELLEPRGRNRMSAGDYGAGGHAVRYLGYQVEEAKVNGYFADVRVRLLVVPIFNDGRKVGPQVTVTEDSWVRIRGTWYRSLEQDQSQRSLAEGR